MSTFIQVQNGFVNGRVNGADVLAVRDNVRAFLNSTVQNYELKTNPLIYREILLYIRTITGENFKDFLTANYKNGLAPCASIISTILLYLEDKTSARAIVGEIRRSESIVEYNNETVGAWDKRTINQTRTVSNGPSVLDNITNFDFYRLIRAIGIENMARFILVLLGVTRHA